MARPVAVSVTGLQAWRFEILSDRDADVGLVQPEGRDGVSPARDRRVEGQERPPAASAATQCRVMTLTEDRRSTAQS
jgi:hypothetical protein